MEIFVTVLALAFLQVWGGRNPLHKDLWFYTWREKLLKKAVPAQVPEAEQAQDKTSDNEWLSFISIALPLLLALVLFHLLASQSIWLVLPFAVVVLLYSFGRGEFFEIVREYTQACYVEDWESATSRANRFYVDVAAVEENDWSTLHRNVFDEASYRGFERMFAVLFWFFALGPVGALMYRLVFMSAQSEVSSGDTRDNEPVETLARRWLWIIEWPAVRLLGLSFALTGNFSGCIEYWRECAACLKRSTRAALSPMVLGALAVNDEVTPDCEVTRKELTLMSKLYKRTLWFWLCAVSIMVIFA